MGVFILLIGLFLISGIIKNNKPNSAKKKGNEGEDLVNKFLKSKSKDGLLLSNLTIRENEKYTQIDHVFITNKAIFVIETKNHSGFVIGGKADLNWTVMYGKSKYKMYNPLKQNETHVNTIRRVIEDKNINIVPIVIFSNEKCKFKEQPEGVHRLEEFKSQYTSLVNIKGMRIDKEGIYNKLKSIDVSGSKIQTMKQVRYAKRSKTRRKDD